MSLLSRFSYVVFLMLFFFGSIVGLAFTTTQASEIQDNPTVLSTPSEQPLVARKKGDRQRSGECGHSPQIWALNVCQSNTFCYVAPEEVSLWLSKETRSGRSVRVLIKNLQTEEKTGLGWQASKTTLAWPLEQVPLVSGNVYLVQIRKQQILLEKKIYLHQLPTDLQTRDDKAEWMKQTGCQLQAEMLRTETPPPPTQNQHIFFHKVFPRVLTVRCDGGLN